MYNSHAFSIGLFYFDVTLHVYFLTWIIFVQPLDIVCRLVEKIKTKDIRDKSINVKLYCMEKKYRCVQEWSEWSSFVAITIIYLRFMRTHREIKSVNFLNRLPFCKWSFPWIKVLVHLQMSVCHYYVIKIMHDYTISKLSLSIYSQFILYPPFSYLFQIIKTL